MITITEKVLSIKLSILTSPIDGAIGAYDGEYYFLPRWNQEAKFPLLLKNNVYDNIYKSTCLF
jgi:hypothetical protein